MHSAFKKGIKLLSEPESDSVWSQGQSLANLRERAFEDWKGTEVPKNATQLKPIIDKLINKVIIIAFWLIPANTM